MTDERERRSRSEGFREGIRQGLGILSAFKDAVEETIREARERGDLSSDRAREIMKEAMERAQAAADDARDRFDFATRSELEDLRSEVEALRNRVSRLEDAPSAERAGTKRTGRDAGGTGPGA